MAEHERLLLTVVGYRQGELTREITASVNNLERGMHSRNRGCDIGPRRICWQVSVEHDAQFVLEARLDQCVLTEEVAGFDEALRQQTGKDRLVQAKLLLNDRCREANLPADAAGSRAAAATDQRQQDGVGLIEGEPIMPRPRKKFAARPRCLKFRTAAAISLWSIVP